MAKIHFTTPHNQENLSVFASLGVLICMIVTLVGIKLWWFKHRLSFEQKSSPSSKTNESPTPAVLVPRRSKQPKYKKDKRYSQQIYESVEVHGVFRQKREDEFEIQRPAQLPPVRIRQTSESNSVLIRPPPRTKRRDQVHSTAFEDLEIETPPVLATASSSDLSVIPEINTKITLTFEEFERQFNLREIKHGLEQPETSANNEISEIPKRPLRLNRSSSSATKPEKPVRNLKLSQSITMPEFHKVTQKRTVVVHSSPKEDLTKIDYYEEAKMFENFAKPKVKSAGYIKYEEVDNEIHEKELNIEADKQDYYVIDSGFYDSPQSAKALKTLRNESVIYDNDDGNESPAANLTNAFSFNRKPPYRINEWDEAESEEVDFSRHNFSKENKEMKKFGLKDSTFYNNTHSESSREKTKSLNEIEKDSGNFEKNYLTESQIFPTEIILENTCGNEHRAHEFEKNYHTEEENPSMEVNKKAELFSSLESYEKDFITKPPTTENQSPAAENETDVVFNDHQTKDEHAQENHLINGKKSPESYQKSVAKTSTPESLVNFEEDFDSQFESWPQFQEKIETPQVTIRRFNNHNLQAQNSFNENDDFEETSSSHSNTNELGNVDQTGMSLKERRPTGYANYRPESPELEDMDEWQQAFNNKLYTHVRSFITAEESLSSSAGREVSFDSSALKQTDNNSNKTSAIRQRRPTGYIKRDEYLKTSSEESDEDTNDEREAVHVAKVKFEDGILAPEHETEIYTLNLRRPTGFVRPSNKDELSEMFDGQVKFDETTVFKEAENDSIIKQRRPTGFIKNLEILDLSDDASLKEDSLNSAEVSQNGHTVRFIETARDSETTADSLLKQRRPTGYIRPVIDSGSSTNRFSEADKHLQDSENKTVTFDSPTVRFMESEKNVEDYETNTESLVKQRRPTGYVRQAELLAIEKEVSFQLPNENNETSTQKNEALQQRRPTGFIRREEITKQVNFQLTENSQENEKTEYRNEQLKERRPTGFVKRRELKCLDQPAPIYQPENNDNDKQEFDDHLWQELEKEVAQDFSHNFEEEFAKIRHSYELNEADFLELKDEKQKMSPTEPAQQCLGFGKTIDDDWENFQQLKSQVIIIPSPTPEEKIKITFSDNDLANTTSILKDSKLEEDVALRARKSKVTFDFKTEEHVIPARKSHNYSEEDIDFEDNECNSTPALIPPQPLKRSTNINYNNETQITPIAAISSSITFFGTQATAENQEEEDSWAAIRKHRNMQYFSADSGQSLQATSSNMPPKPAYRNPMAQLAIQRAKEVRADMDGFKSRSINDRKPETLARQKQKLLNLSNAGNDEGTEA